VGKQVVEIPDDIVLRDIINLQVDWFSASFKHRGAQQTILVLHLAIALQHVYLKRSLRPIWKNGSKGGGARQRLGGLRWRSLALKSVMVPAAGKCISQQRDHSHCDFLNGEFPDKGVVAQRTPNISPEFRHN
jgi:hypothetical protein